MTAQYAPAGSQPAGAPTAQYPPTLKEPTMIDQPARPAMTMREIRDALGHTRPAGPADQPEPETDEQRADREETEREHAAGIHTHCGLTCEVDLPTEHLRNFIIAKGYPGTAGALDELLRRAATPAVAPTAPPAADLRDRIAEALARTDGLPWGHGQDSLPSGIIEQYHRHADAVLAVLPALTAPAAVCPECGDAGACNGGPCPLADRRARYAALFRSAPGEDRLGDATPGEIADAVMAVADAEQAALRAEADALSAELTRRAPLLGEHANEIIRLRAEVERLRADRAELIRQRDQAVMDTIKALPAPIDRATVLREAVEVAGQMGGRFGTDDHGDIDEGWNDACKAISTELRRMADEAQQPETEDDDPICGDRYDDETCELEPEHPGAHCAGIVCWDYGRAPAPAPTEEPTR